MEILELDPASIEAGDDRARPLDPLVVEALAGAIREQGLLQPIVVRREGDGHRLVAGWHRLEAVRRLEWPLILARVLEVASDDEARLAEVMENLGRGELIALDRCRHLYELKQVWERLYPHTKNGGDPATKAEAARIRISDSGTDAPEVFGFVRACAEKIGLGRSQISDAVKAWIGLSPASRHDLRGKNLATKMTELKALSALPAKKQAEVLKAIFDEDLPEIGNVAQALAYLGENIVCNPLEKMFQSVSRSIATLDDETFDSVIAAHEDRVISSLKRRGRI